MRLLCSCTGSRWSSVCASKTASWERTALVCCLRTVSWSMLSQIGLKCCRLTRPAPPFRCTTTRTSSPSTSSASPSKIWKTKWGDVAFQRFFVTARADTAYQKIWRLDNNFVCSHNKVDCSEIPIVLSNLLYHNFFHWIMAHFNFVISQNAKWGHAGFYIDRHRMTSSKYAYRKGLFYKKSTGDDDDDVTAIGIVWLVAAEHAQWHYIALSKWGDTLGHNNEGARPEANVMVLLNEAVYGSHHPIIYIPVGSHAFPVAGAKVERPTKRCHISFVVCGDVQE